MKIHLISGALLLVLVVTAHAQSAQQLTKATGETKPSVSNSSVPKDGATPELSLMLPVKAKKNPTCGGVANTNPCGAIKKKRPRSPQTPSLTVSQSDLVSTSAPLDRSDLDPIGPRAFVLNPQTPEIALIHINGVEMAVKNPMIVSVQPHAAGSTPTAPTVTDYSPRFGNPGTVVTISGSGFGLPQVSSIVTVISAATRATIAWPIQSWTDSQIVTTVPANTPQGLFYFYIYVGGQVVAGTYPFEVGIPPSVISYSPGFGLPGTHITIKGLGFGPPKSTSYLLTLSQVTNTWANWPTTNWTDTQIDVNVPAGFPPGIVELRVWVDGLEAIGTYPFTVGIPPMIDCYSPLSGPPTTLVTINGSGFRSTQGDSTVQVFSRLTNTYSTWPVSTWSDRQITLAVPANEPIGLYYFTVVVDALRSGGTYPFEVGFPPVISDYSPRWGNPGTQITVDGSGFGQTQGTSVLQVLSSVTNTWTNLAVTSWTDTRIVATIPETMPIGKVYLDVIVGPALTAGGLESIGTFPFDVGIPPLLTSYSPNTGPAGTIVTINGTGFGSTQGGGYVTLQSVTNVYTTLTVVSWSDTQVTASIPKLTPICLSYLSITVDDGLQTPGTFPFQVTKQ